jgi:hypothetical protein
VDDPRKERGSSTSTGGRPAITSKAAAKVSSENFPLHDKLGVRQTAMAEYYSHSKHTSSIRSKLSLRA